VQKYYFSVCANFRDEAPYLYEWIVYHLLVGVEHFYLYNHKSKDNYMEILQPFIDKGLVTLNDMSDDYLRKPASQKGRLKKIKEEMQEIYIGGHANDSRWTAFIDLDEFIMFEDKNDNLQNIMKEYEAYPGVGLCWKWYGSSGILKKDPGLVIERFLEYVPLEIYKTIVNPREVDLSGIRYAPAHVFSYKNGAKAVDEKFEKLENWERSKCAYADIPPLEYVSAQSATHSRFYVSHYYWKSLEEYKNRRHLSPSDANGRPKDRDPNCGTWHLYGNNPQYRNLYHHYIWAHSRGQRGSSTIPYGKNEVDAHPHFSLSQMMEDRSILLIAKKIREFDLDLFCDKKEAC